jgi:hypothetical protein
MAKELTVTIRVHLTVFEEDKVEDVKRKIGHYDLNGVVGDVITRDILDGIEVHQWTRTTVKDA